MSDSNYFDPVREIPGARLQMVPAMKTRDEMFRELPDFIKEAYLRDPVVHNYVSAYLFLKINKWEFMEALLGRKMEEAEHFKRLAADCMKYHGFPNDVVIIRKEP